MFTLKQQLIMVLMRIFPLATKFIFSVLIIKYYKLSEIGKYNNAIGYVSVLVFIIGLQFSYCTSRDLSSSNTQKKISIVTTQSFIFMLIYAVIAIPVYIFFDNRYGVGFAALSFLVFSHFSLEIYKILYSIRKPVHAAFIYSLGNGFWTLPIMLLLVLGRYPSIENIIFTTASFSFLSILLGVFFLFVELDGRNSFFFVDIKYARTCFVVCIPIMLSTVAYRGSELLGRFALEFTDGLASVGVFSSYQVIACSLLIMAESGIAVVSLPYLVDAYKKNSVLYSKLKIKVIRQTLCLSIFGTFLSVILSKYFFKIIGRADLLNDIHNYYVIAFSYFFLSSAIPYSLFMYVQKKDKYTVFFNVSLSILNIIIVFVFVYYLKMGALGASLSLLVWSVMQFFVKYYYVSVCCSNVSNVSEA